MTNISCSAKSNKSKSSESGFTLIEVVFAAAIGFVVAIGMGLHFYINASTVEMTARTIRAHDAAYAGLETLTSHSDNFDEGTSFTITDPTTISPSVCSDAWCDQLQANDDGARTGSTDSVAGGTKWSAGLPTEAHREFVRRFRVIRVKPDLREITIAVLTTPESTQPLVILTTRVADRKPKP